MWVWACTCGRGGVIEEDGLPPWAEGSVLDVAKRAVEEHMNGVMGKHIAYLGQASHGAKTATTVAWEAAP